MRGTPFEFHHTIVPRSPGFAEEDSLWGVIGKGHGFSGDAGVIITGNPTRARQAAFAPTKS